MSEANERAGELEERRELADRIDRELGPFPPLHLDALVKVDRARFVRAGDERRSCEDVPLALDDEGLATVSAPHAYMLSFRLVELAPGDRLVELGTGSGYGAALASEIVGPTGHVASFEIDPRLAARARELLADRSNVTTYLGDGVDVRNWRSPRRVICTFAIDEMPEPWIAALADGGVLVAPVGAGLNQDLVRVVRHGANITTTQHGCVRYVRNRSTA